MVNSINSLGDNSQDQELLKRKEDFNKARSVFEKKKPTTTLTTTSKITVTSLSPASSSTNTNSTPTKPEMPPKPSNATTTEEAANKTTIVAQNSSTLSQAFSYYVWYGVFGTKLPDELYAKELDRLKEVIKENPVYFAHVGKYFQDDKKLALIAVKGNGKMLKYASYRLQKDEDILLAAAEQNGLAPKLAGIQLENKKIALVAVAQNPEAFLSLSPKLKTDPDIIKTTFSRTKGQPDWFRYLDLDITTWTPDLTFTANKDAMLLAITENGAVYYNADRSIRNDFDLKFAAIKQGDEIILDNLHNWYIWDNVELAAVALEKRGALLAHAQSNVRKSKIAVIPAVTQNGLALKDADKTLQDDIEVVIPAVKQNGLAIQHASERLRKDPRVKTACNYG